jgi:drug/metabolite transporter (DMT)-like permease
MKKETQGMLIGLVGVVIFSLTLPITKLAVEVFSPGFVSFGRATLAGLAGLIYIYFQKAPLPSLQTIKRLLWIVIGVVIGFPYLMTQAMANGSSSHGGIILGFMPLLTTIVGVIKFKERPSKGFWFASMLGTSLVLTYALIQGSGSLSKMDFLLVGAAVLSAVGYAEGAELSRIMSPKLVISWAVAIALPLNVMVAFFHFEPSYAHVDIKYFLAFLFLGLFSMYIGFFFWYEGLAMGGISRVSQVQLTQPFIILICSNLLLGEQLEAINFIFAGLVVSSVLLGKQMLVKRNHV